MNIKNKKKGAIKISDAPSVVMIVGFIFILMATIAFVAEEYQEGIGAGVSGTFTNQSVYLNGTSFEVVDPDGYCNFEDFAVTSAINKTDAAAILVGNYTVSSTDATVVNATDDWDASYEVYVTGTFAYGGASCNVTEGLQTELSDNTSIAGIVLTISLIGIVLSILIGIFVASRRNGM